MQRSLQSGPRFYQKSLPPPDLQYTAGSVPLHSAVPLSVPLSDNQTTNMFFPCAGYVLALQKMILVPLSMAVGYHLWVSIKTIISLWAFTGQFPLVLALIWSGSVYCVSAYWSCCLSVNWTWLFGCHGCSGGGFRQGCCGPSRQARWLWVTWLCCWVSLFLWSF